MKRGMVLGKFLPPHLGHLYLCEFAERACDDLTVVVGTLAREPIPGDLRFRWMRELLPGARVVHLTDENPQDPSEHPDFWAIWKASLERVLPHPVDYVFASEPYGHKLAEILGAEFVPVDVARAAIPVSGTGIRAAPLAHWEHLPRCVRPWFVKRVCVFGPESTGKSTLAENLAKRFNTVCVPEYARTFLEPREGRLVHDDMERIARGQIASEDALARSADRVLFADTDVLLTTLWSRTLFGACAPWIEQQAEARTYDLTLLTDVDVPWVADPVRYLPDDRRPFFERCEAELRRLGRPYLVIRGGWDERLEIAVTAVQSLLNGPR
jgi:HTH-type transcriptional repressor of NAD biosynthesis genes